MSEIRPQVLGKYNSPRGRKEEAHREILSAVKRIADQIDRETRELYHLLPEHLRPTETPRPQKPREPHHEGPNEREHSGSKPGGKIPREVRWPAWTVEQILELADAFHEKHKKWPNKHSGRINDTSPDTWNGIDIALQRGNRDLSGGTTLVKLLWEHRGVKTRSIKPPLEIETILTWANDHHAHTETWPTQHSGSVIAAPDETWNGINHALVRGTRGLQPAGRHCQTLTSRRYSTGRIATTSATVGGPTAGLVRSKTPPTKPGSLWMRHSRTRDGGSPNADIIRYLTSWTSG